MDHPSLIRITRAGATYDLAATLGFATPWTARRVLGALAALPLGGAAFSPFDESQLLFVSLMGTVVAMWSLVRLIWPRRELLLADTLGRVAFATWLARAAADGAPRATLVFAALEVAWLAVQAYALWRYKPPAAPVLA